jgi:hypothetical protein
VVQSDFTFEQVAQKQIKTDNVQEVAEDGTELCHEGLEIIFYNILILKHVFVYSKFLQNGVLL